MSGPLSSVPEFTLSTDSSLLAQAAASIENPFELPEWKTINPPGSLPTDRTIQLETPSEIITKEQNSPRIVTSPVALKDTTITEQQALEYLQEFAHKRENIPPIELLQTPIFIQDPSKVKALTSITLQRSDGSQEVVSIYEYNGTRYLGFVSDGTVSLNVEIKTEDQGLVYPFIYALYGLTVTFRYEQDRLTVEQIFNMLTMQFSKDMLGMLVITGDQEFLQADTIYAEWMKRSFFSFFTSTFLQISSNAVVKWTSLGPYKDKMIPGDSLLGFSGYLSIFSLLVAEEMREESRFGLHPIEHTAVGNRLTSWRDFENKYRPRFGALLISSFVNGMLYRTDLMKPHLVINPKKWIAAAINLVRNDSYKIDIAFFRVTSFLKNMFLQILIATIIADSPLAPDDKNKVIAHLMAMLSDYTSALNQRYAKQWFGGILEKFIIELRLNAVLHDGDVVQHLKLQKRLDEINSEPLVTAQEMEKIVKLIQQGTESAGYVLNGDATSHIGNLVQSFVSGLKGMGDILAMWLTSDPDRARYHRNMAQLALRQRELAIRKATGTVQPKNFAELLLDIQRLPLDDIAETMKRRLMDGPPGLIIDSVNNLDQLYQQMGQRIRFRLAPMPDLLENPQTSFKMALWGIVSAAHDIGRLHLVIEKLKEFELAARNGDKQAEQIAFDLRNTLRLTFSHDGITELSPELRNSLTRYILLLSNRNKLTLDLLIRWTGIRKPAGDFTAKDFEALRDLVLYFGTEARLADLGMKKEDLLVTVLARQRSPNGQAGAIRALTNYSTYEEVFNKANFTGDWLADAIRSSRVDKTERQALWFLLKVNNYKDLVNAVLEEWPGSNKNRLRGQDISSLIQITDRDVVRELLERYDKTPEYLLVSVLSQLKPSALFSLIDDPSQMADLGVAGYPDVAQWLSSAINSNVHALPGSADRQELKEKLEQLHPRNGVDIPDAFDNLMIIMRGLRSHEMAQTVRQQLIDGPAALITDTLNNLDKVIDELGDEPEIRQAFVGIVLAARDKGLLHIVIEKFDKFERNAAGGNRQAEPIAKHLQFALERAVWYDGKLSLTGINYYRTDKPILLAGRREQLIIDRLIRWEAVRKPVENLTAKDFEALAGLITDSEIIKRLEYYNKTRSTGEKKFTQKDLLVSILAHQRSLDGQAAAIRALIENPDYHKIIIDVGFIGPWLGSAVEYSQVSRNERREIAWDYNQRVAGRHNELTDNYDQLIGRLLSQWSGHDKTMSELSRQDMRELKNLIYSAEDELAALAAADDSKKDDDEKKDYSKKGALVSMLARSPVAVIGFLLRHLEEIRFLEIAGFGDPMGIKQPPGWVAAAITYHTSATEAQKQKFEARLQGLKQDYLVDKQTGANEIIDNAFKGIPTEPIPSAPVGDVPPNTITVPPLIPTISPVDLDPSLLQSPLNPNLDDVFKNLRIPGTTPGRRL